MLAKRIIPCLDVDHGKVKKGINFKILVDVGSPVRNLLRNMNFKELTSWFFGTLRQRLIKENNG